MNPTQLPLPNPVQSRSTGAACRNLLDQIKSLTFTCQNQDVLITLQKQLFECLTDLKEEATKDDGLVVENLDGKSKNATKRHVSSDASSQAKLPSPAKRPNNSRVGMAAKLKREAKGHFLDINTGKIGMEQKLPTILIFNKLTMFFLARNRNKLSLLGSFLNSVQFSLF